MPTSTRHPPPYWRAFIGVYLDAPELAHALWAQAVQDWPAEPLRQIRLFDVLPRATLLARIAALEETLTPKKLIALTEALVASGQARSPALVAFEATVLRKTCRREGVPT